LQVSVRVQPLPSLQDAPSGFAGFEQRPVPVSHTPAVWQVSLAVQLTGLVPAQAPNWQTSVWVQALPSLQVPGSVSVVGATAVLLPGAGSVFALEAVKAAMLVPLPAQTLTFTTIVKLTLPVAASEGAVHEIAPVPPTAGFVQLHPTGGAIDWNVVLGGVAPLSCALAAALGPPFVTDTVYAMLCPA
jgi:hypothetical protein